ncbi:OsmC family protein [Ancylobacter sp. A5.8]|uniref:OsmC family protein n=1 Tax=Ancylobacter gelatini TaxID=2919920 RepID=UPI001F4DCB72|nr:OsmC family protein [Ancylobacter gelatini]MCJ8144974.1 OsmC family protein [Ancylobacter gelatini]
MNRFGSAHWTGDIKHGRGTITTESGKVSELPYSFFTRFGDEPGSNPEELIGGAHAGCFAMALSGALTAAGFTAESLDTKSIVTVEKDGAGFTITGVHLSVTAKVPGIDEAAFLKIAQGAKAGCPVSRLMSVPIAFDAELVAG